MNESLTVTRNYDFPAEKVFDAFLDPAQARRFMFVTETGEITKAEIDAQVGGSFVISDRRPEMGDVEHEGVFVEIDRPSRLSFAFSVPKYSPDSSLVTIEIAARGKRCELSLTQELDPKYVPMKDKVAETWAGILASLERVLGESGDENASVVQPRDSNGTSLSEGDSVTVIKDLDVKGSSITLKRGTMIKGIRITDDPENIECRVSGSTLVLKTCFLKKA